MSKVPEGVDRQELNVVARRVLLDALNGLRDQADAVTIVGAQAIYLRSVDVGLSVASFTSDADLGLDPELLADSPRLEQAMRRAGFDRRVADSAGSWVRTERVNGVAADIPVDLLVPESLSTGGRRSANIPPHHGMSVRRVNGLEAAMVDADLMDVPSLDPSTDHRAITARVAGPAALFIAKAYKIYERADEPGQRRLVDKDAGDVVRLMRADAGDPADVARRFKKLADDERTAAVAETGLTYLQQLFGSSATLGTRMAVDALEGAVAAQTVRALTPAYVEDLQAAIADLR